MTDVFVEPKNSTCKMHQLEMGDFFTFTDGYLYYHAGKHLPEELRDYDINDSSSIDDDTIRAINVEKKELKLFGKNITVYPEPHIFINRMNVASDP